MIIVLFLLSTFEPLTLLTFGCLLWRIFAIYSLYYIYNIFVCKTGVAYIHLGWLTLLPLLFISLYSIVSNDANWLNIPDYWESSPKSCVKVPSTMFAIF